ncbi:MAG: A/G-specific adenine glycosylase [Chloroflexota bacterium]
MRSGLEKKNTEGRLGPQRFAAYGGRVGESYTVSRRLLAHYQATKRDLPWRKTRDPYAVLVSEMMLQQTQAARVAPRFERFMDRFPTLGSLAAAPLAAVLREWSGLGYNRRARDLHRIARICKESLPRDVAQLDALPGVGAYTAGAIASFAHGQRVAFADVNIRRVLGRIFLARAGTLQEGVDLDARAMPERDSDLWHHALMDLGATICTSRDPKCDACPLNSLCCFANGSVRSAASALRGAVGGSLRRGARRREAQSAAAGRQATARKRPSAFKDSDRRVRGAIVRVLVEAQSGLTVRAIEKSIGDERVPRLVEKLMADGLIERAGRRVRLAS